MALIRKIDGVGPVIGENVFIAENAAILGDVRIARDASIWYGAVLRGDAGSITIGERSNVQDGVVIHATQGESTTVIGRDVTIGHNAVVHGARIGNDGTIVAAGAVVLSNAVLEPGIYAGIPAKKVKEGSEEMTRMIHENAAHYLHYTQWYSA